jgi:hypothetical protein
MAVSEVGRIARGSSRSDWPLHQGVQSKYDVAIGWRELDARSRNPSDLRGETFDVILLPLEHLRGHKHREVCILNAHLPDLRVEPLFVIASMKLLEHKVVTEKSIAVPWMISHMLYDHGLRT